MVSTDSIDISGKDQSFSARVHLYVEDAMVRFVNFSETTVDITIVPIEKTVPEES